MQAAIVCEADTETASAATAAHGVLQAYHLQGTTLLLPARRCARYITAACDTNKNAGDAGSSGGASEGATQFDQRSAQVPEQYRAESQREMQKSKARAMLPRSTNGILLWRRRYYTENVECM